MKIIGREHEQTELQRLFDSGNPEFVMIYGRRRVGKKRMTVSRRQIFLDLKK